MELKGKYDGLMVKCPDCGTEIIIEYDAARCTVCGWSCTDPELEELLEE